MNDRNDAQTNGHLLSETNGSNQVYDWAEISSPNAGGRNAALRPKPIYILYSSNWTSCTFDSNPSLDV